MPHRHGRAWQGSAGPHLLRPTMPYRAPPYGRARQGSAGQSRARQTARKSSLGLDKARKIPNNLSTAARASLTRCPPPSADAAAASSRASPAAFFSDAEELAVSDEAGATSGAPTAVGGCWLLLLLHFLFLLLVLFALLLLVFASFRLCFFSSPGASALIYFRGDLNLGGHHIHRNAQTAPHVHIHRGVVDTVGPQMLEELCAA